MHWSPWNGGSPPDSETLPLTPYLSAMNRLGYITEFSQPGIANAQRASVTGFCEKAQAECLASLSLDGDLVVVSEYPGVEATYELPITQDERRTFHRPGWPPYCRRDLGAAPPYLVAALKVSLRFDLRSVLGTGQSALDLCNCGPKARPSRLHRLS